MSITFPMSEHLGLDTLIIIGIVIAGVAALSSRALIVSAPVDLSGMRVRSALFTARSVISEIV